MLMELGWLDYSEEYRQRAIAVLSALTESEAVDELGIGIIRDAFSQALFPATSVLMTSAKYFFLVAYGLQDLESENTKGMSARSLRARYDHIEEDIAKKLIKHV